MKVFFDNCTAPVLAETLNAFIQKEGHAAFHIAKIPELPNGRHSRDIEWIEFLRTSADRWMFITGDGRLMKNKAERAALKSAGLHGFVLAASYQRTPLHHVAAALIWKWPEMLQLTELLSPPTMHEVPMKIGTKPRQMPV